MAVVAETRTVYRSERRRRSFLTRGAAIRAEAIAIIKAKYPTEPGEPDVGDPGWHWSELKRSDVLLRRMLRKVAATPETPNA